MSATGRCSVTDRPGRLPASVRGLRNLCGADAARDKSVCCMITFVPVLEATVEVKTVVASGRAVGLEDVPGTC